MLFFRNTSVFNSRMKRKYNIIQETEKRNETKTKNPLQTIQTRSTLLMPNQYPDIFLGRLLVVHQNVVHGPLLKSTQRSSALVEVFRSLSGPFFISRNEKVDATYYIHRY